MRPAKQLTLLATLAACGLAAPAMADFNYPNFASTAGLTLVGNATQTSNSILVTPSLGSQAGAVWVNQKQMVSSGFDASMTIHIDDKQGQGADGIALVIQNSSGEALGGRGGGVGYGDNPTFGFSGIPNSVAIVFDMWNNNVNWPEPGDNHVSIQSNGTGANSPLLQYSLGNAATPDLSDGQQHVLRVNYTAGIMSVYIDGNLSPVLQRALDLSSLISLDQGGNAWVGVTAATGGTADREAHVLDSFALTSCNIPTP
ncbi:MAG TPA: L-type lectin-domain containing protein, partial [Phycisphaerales bacterium]|nr:L-type lectin-domain containing protein [Phycisphaerales bacterium]